MSSRPHVRAGIDGQLLDIGLRLTPAQRLQWLEKTVEELLPWLGLASRPELADSESRLPAAPVDAD